MNGSFFVPHDLEAPVRGAATGPLAGLTVVVKDMYDIAGSRTGGGSPEWLAEQKPATRNAAVVEQILAAGATITGKTICDEFFYSVTGVNAHYGTTKNLRAPGRLRRHRLMWVAGLPTRRASFSASEPCYYEALRSQRQLGIS